MQTTSPRSPTTDARRHPAGTTTQPHAPRSLRARVPAALLALGAAALALAAGLAGCGDESPATVQSSGGDATTELDDAAAAGALYLSAITTSAATASSTAGVVAGLTGVGNAGAGAGAVWAGGAGDTLLGSSCPVIAYQASGTSFSLSLDYGAGCVPQHGELEHAGRVAVEATAADPGVNLTITWDAYSVESIGVDGTVAASLIDDTLSWTVDGTIADQGGASVTGVASMAATLDAGAPADPDDDALAVTGSGTIETGELALAFEIDPAAPLELQASCDYPVAGVVTLASAAGTARIDYGDGDCDSLATVSIGPLSWEIDLANVDLCDLLGC